MIDGVSISSGKPHLSEVPSTEHIHKEEKKQQEIPPSSLRTFVEEAELGIDVDPAQSYQTPNINQ